ncbi:Nif11-like leader peptide family natural product precursor (plasmid) [Nostoc sp. UHCC 0926]|uniref:Nif11-like leader peptide family natural product precursor n=1 Tax=Nostoc sp. UHCC 0926 TaxID=3025190 RepID=UPI0023604EE4|nr:Nif11-like leader peptide family natural product precursor [Nostoc sp. UHCC 0926]WDD36984.1 Nif11-like leader peptide family natural product precursor [Nostoc sp. UHCC 0926]
MSTQAVNQFLQKVTEDAQLQQKFAKALEAGNDIQATTDLAVKHGYQFTPDELRVEIQNRQNEFQRRQDAGELNEEELEAAAGGTATPYTAVIGGVIGAAGAITGGIITATVNK